MALSHVEHALKNLPRSTARARPACGRGRNRLPTRLGTPLAAAIMIARGTSPVTRIDDDERRGTHVIHAKPQVAARHRSDHGVDNYWCVLHWHRPAAPQR